ncbi:DUF6049 family protein [Agromyces sp. SYSU T00194]|uniref:DUF6049 family protein n=1 Tax=Agromyces chitinivorans TaxID=3158560 RepID=UPI003393C218
MAAEAIPVRRPRRLLAAVAAGATAAGFLLGAPASVPAAAAELDGLTLVVAPTDAPVITDVSDTTSFTVETGNATGRFLTDVDIVVGLAGRALGSTDALADWTAGTDSAPSGTELARETLSAVPNGSTLTTRIEVDTGDLAQDATAALPLFVALEDDGETIAWSTGVAVWSAGDDIGSVSLAVAAPITVPGQDEGLYPAELLEGWTSPQGILTRRLDALADTPVALAIDPAIIASIRVLGADAPESALAWLDRLGTVTNETFPLAYADADLAAQAQAGLDAPLQPTTFDDVADPEDLVVPSAEPEATDLPASPDATPAPTTEPGADEVEAPVPGVLDFAYTRTDIAWPADDTLADGDLAFLDEAGLTTAIVAGTNVEAVTGAARDAAATIGGATAVVSDIEVTDALRAAEAATTTTEWAAANADLAASLALIAADGGSSGRTLLATFARTQPVSTERVAGAIETIGGLPWTEAASLSQAIGAPPTSRALRSSPEADDRIARIRTMVEYDGELAEFSTILDEPEQLTAAYRRDLLAVLGASWVSDTTGWDSTSSAFVSGTREVLDAVSIVPSSEFTVISRESGILVTVQNDLPYPVNVVITVDPSNGRLLVEGPVETTIEPDSRGTTTVPVQAGVGNGAVALLVSLESPAGVPVGNTVRFGANVQADWEGIGAAVMGAALAILFGLGIWRIIRRRRQERADEASPAEADGDDATDDHGDDADSEEHRSDRADADEQDATSGAGEHEEPNGGR